MAHAVCLYQSLISHSHISHSFRVDGRRLPSAVKHFPAKWKCRPALEISSMTTSSDTPDWRSMSQQERDLGLNNGVARARQRRDRRRLGPAFRRDAGAISRSSRPAIWPARAQPDRFLQGRRTRRRRCCSSTAATGRRAPRRPLRCFADGPMAHGINVALIGYTLAPDATLDEIVAEIHAGIDFLAGQLPALGGDGQGIVVSGWSAGGHLTSMALSHPEREGGDGDIGHLRSRADPPQLSQREAAGSTKRPRAATRR